MLGKNCCYMICSIYLISKEKKPSPQKKPLQGIYLFHACGTKSVFQQFNNKILRFYHRSDNVSGFVCIIFSYYFNLQHAPGTSADDRYFSCFCQKIGLVTSFKASMERCLKWNIHHYFLAKKKSGYNTFNPFMPSELCYLNSLDRSISN